MKNLLRSPSSVRARFRFRLPNLSRSDFLVGMAILSWIGFRVPPLISRCRYSVAGMDPTTSNLFYEGNFGFREAKPTLETDRVLLLGSKRTDFFV